MGKEKPARVYTLKTRRRQGRDPSYKPKTGDFGYVRSSRLMAGSSRHAPGKSLDSNYTPTCKAHHETSIPPTRENPVPTFVYEIEYWNQAVFDQRVMELANDPFSAAASPFRIWLSEKQLGDLGICSPGSRPGQVYVKNSSQTYLADICLSKHPQCGVRISERLADVLLVREGAQLEMYLAEQPAPVPSDLEKKTEPELSEPAPAEESGPDAPRSWVEEVYGSNKDQLPMFPGKDRCTPPPGAKDVSTPQLPAYFLLPRKKIR